MKIVENPNFLLGICLLIWGIFWSLQASILPLFPVDETRYLTVAWEMYKSGNWILPSLNTEAYSHKPPMLFWLVNSVWLVLGTHIWTARLVSFFSMIAVIFLTKDLAKKLFPQEPKIVNQSPVYLLANPAFMIYGLLIMFDVLLSVWVMLGLNFLWRASNNNFKYWLFFGISMGLGVLTKGPVIAVYLIPVALLYPIWRSETSEISGKEWYLRVFAAFVIAVVIGLSWAIPAALYGGPEFSRMIFWKQSAGRMVSAFDHARPFWFYIPILLLYCLPFLFWPAFWRGFRNIRSLTKSELFLLCFVIPVFLIFSLMSSKQPHYLIPLIPCISLFLLKNVGGQKVEKPTLDFLILQLPFAFLFIGLSTIHFFKSHLPESNIVDAVLLMNPITYSAGGIISLTLLYIFRKSVNTQIFAILLSVAILFSCISIEASKKLYPLYDLRPLATALQPYKDRPVAFVHKYAGEIGFLARLDKKVYPMTAYPLKDWFLAHPDGYAVVRHERTFDMKGYEVLYTQPYKSHQFFTIIRPES